MGKLKTADMGVAVYVLAAFIMLIAYSCGRRESPD